MQEQQESVIARCKAADPKHGEKWTQVSKATGECLATRFFFLPFQFTTPSLAENVTVGGCKLPVEELLRRVASLI